jgi:hypothetical protein
MERLKASSQELNTITEAVNTPVKNMGEAADIAARNQ